MEFVYDGGGFVKGGIVMFYFDGDKIGEGCVEVIVLLIFFVDEIVDVGCDIVFLVSDDYDGESSVFIGMVNWV